MCVSQATPCTMSLCQPNSQSYGGGGGTHRPQGRREGKGKGKGKGVGRRRRRTHVTTLSEISADCRRSSVMSS
jgi:hypothetical protein